jgi:hypothetical protein
MRNATIMSWSISLVADQMQQGRKASEDRWKVIIKDEIDYGDYADDGLVVSILLMRRYS